MAIFAGEPLDLLAAPLRHHALYRQLGLKATGLSLPQGGDRSSGASALLLRRRGIRADHHQAYRSSTLPSSKARAWAGSRARVGMRPAGAAARCYPARRPARPLPGLAALGPAHNQAACLRMRIATTRSTAAAVRAEAARCAAPGADRGFFEVGQDLVGAAAALTRWLSKPASSEPLRRWVDLLPFAERQGVWCGRRVARRSARRYCNGCASSVASSVLRRHGRRPGRSTASSAIVAAAQDVRRQRRVREQQAAERPPRPLSLMRWPSAEEQVWAQIPICTDRGSAPNLALGRYPAPGLAGARRTHSRTSAPRRGSAAGAQDFRRSAADNSLATRRPHQALALGENKPSAPASSLAASRWSWRQPDLANLKLDRGASAASS